MRSGFLGSVHYIDRDLFALSLGNSPHEYTNLFDDSALPANDLAHVTVGDTHFKYGLAAGEALGHRDLVGMIDKALHNIGQ